MNTNHALQIALRSLVLMALTAGAAACGAAPEGQNTVDEKSPTASSAASSDADPDAGAPSWEKADPRTEPVDPGDYVGSPSQGGPEGPTGGGYAAPQQPTNHTKS